MSNSFRGNDEAISKGQNGRKRKQPRSSSGPVNSSGTTNTTSPSPSSAPLTPSTHTPGDVMSITVALQNSGNSSKTLIKYRDDGFGALDSPSNPLPNIDRFVEEGSLDDNVESFPSHDDINARDTIGRCMNVSKGFSFSKFNCFLQPRDVQEATNATKARFVHIDGNHLTMLKVYHAYKQNNETPTWCYDNSINTRTLKSADNLLTTIGYQFEQWNLVVRTKKVVYIPLKHKN